jgi:hypothetical protein
MSMRRCLAQHYAGLWGATGELARWLDHLLCGRLICLLSAADLDRFVGECREPFMSDTRRGKPR